MLSFFMSILKCLIPAQAPGSVFKVVGSERKEFVVIDQILIEALVCERTVHVDEERSISAVLGNFKIVLRIIVS